jgi:hypothetical protein
MIATTPMGSLDVLAHIDDPTGVSTCYSHVDPAHARHRDDRCPYQGRDRRVDRARAASRTTRALSAHVAVDWRKVFKEQGPFGRTSPFVAFAPNADLMRRRQPRPFEAWFRAQDSNLRCWVQSPVSCRLDDPGSNYEKPSWVRRDLNPHFSGKSRVRFRYVTDPIRQPAPEVVGRKGLEPSSLG